MSDQTLGIGELADAARVSRRAVRFYVQQGLLPLPRGRGRGRHYDESHLRQLRRIGELQAAGHSLDAIRRLLRGEPVAAPPSALPRRRVRPAVSAQLWTRVPLGDGVELHFDAGRFSPDAAALVQIRELTRRLFQISAGTRPDQEGGFDGNDDEEDNAR